MSLWIICAYKRFSSTQIFFFKYAVFVSIWALHIIECVLLLYIYWTLLPGSCVDGVGITGWGELGLGLSKEGFGFELVKMIVKSCGCN